MAGPLRGLQQNAVGGDAVDRSAQTSLSPHKLVPRIAGDHRIQGGARAGQDSARGRSDGRRIRQDLLYPASGLNGLPFTMPTAASDPMISGSSARRAPFAPNR
jgi:hypothetical protein